MYTIGYDIGSSSIKASLVALETGKPMATVQEPEHEMKIDSPQIGWAEQDPTLWWQYVCSATRKLMASFPNLQDQVQGIGISYQMHGLVMVDKDLEVLRPSIIWCDSRAVEIGAHAFRQIGEQRSLQCMLNSPGNFTASKLAWVKENEPEVYSRMHKFMLPGDYIALQLTGELRTTVSGLSEGILWDFENNHLSQSVMEHFGFIQDAVPDLVPACAIQGHLTAKAAVETGLPEGIPVGYRAGDQPNNALSLNVLNPGEVAATGGTSGVVYGVVAKPTYDQQSRVNGFAHVNHTPSDQRIGILLCINGAGRMYAWMRQLLGAQLTYPQMEEMATTVSPGSDGLTILPFGNGAERMLLNRDLGVHLQGLQLNRHTRAHMIRASLEGVAFAFNYGIKLMHGLGIDTSVIKVGNDNLFQSKIFARSLANLSGARIDVMKATGATGAALAAAYGIGSFDSLEDAMDKVECINQIEPVESSAHMEAYDRWEDHLQRVLNKLPA